MPEEMPLLQDVMGKVSSASHRIRPRRPPPPPPPPTAPTPVTTARANFHRFPFPERDENPTQSALTRHHRRCSEVKPIHSQSTPQSAPTLPPQELPTSPRATDGPLAAPSPAGARQTATRINHARTFAAARTSRRPRRLSGRSTTP